MSYTVYPIPPWDMTAVEDGALVLEPDVTSCPGTWGLGPCPETLGPLDTINGKTTCWRCGWRAA